MERLENFKVQLIIVIAAQVLAVVLLFMFDLQQIAFTVACVVLVNVMIEFWIMNPDGEGKEEYGPGHHPGAGP